MEYVCYSLFHVLLPSLTVCAAGWAWPSVHSTYPILISQVYNRRSDDHLLARTMPYLVVLCFGRTAPVLHPYWEGFVFLMSGGWCPNPACLPLYQDHCPPAHLVTLSHLQQPHWSPDSLNNTLWSTLFPFSGYPDPSHGHRIPLSHFSLFHVLLPSVWTLSPSHFANLTECVNENNCIVSLAVSQVADCLCGRKEHICCH